MKPSRSAIRAEESEIRSVEAEYDKAWGSGDISRLISFFTDDAVVRDPEGITSRGREEIGRRLGGVLKGEMKGSIHTSRISGVDFVNPDVAIVDGEASISRPDSKEVLLVHGFTDVLVRSEGKWSIAQTRANQNL